MSDETVGSSGRWRRLKGDRVIRSLLAFTAFIVCGCSFHPARRILLEGIEIETRSIAPVSVYDAKAYVDNRVLCVEGIINSAAGEHFHLGGIVTVTAFSKTGAKLEVMCGVFTSTEERKGSRVNRDHGHSDRRFDIRLKSPPEAVKKLIVVSDAQRDEC